MVLASELRRLAESQGWGGAVVSLYLDTRFTETAQPKQLRTFWNEKRKEAEKRGVEGSVLARIDAELETLTSPAGRTLPRGLALFASARRFETVALPCKVESALFIGRRPSLFLLAQADSRCERVLLAEISQKEGRLLEFVGENVVGDQTLDLEAAVKLQAMDDIHEGGGASRGDVKHHDENHRQMKYDLLAERLTYLFDRGPCRVVVSGTHETACEFVERLPKRVADRVKTIPNLKGSVSGDEVGLLLERVLEMVRYDQLGAAVDLEDRIYQEAQGGRGGALGTQDVLLAMQQGRLQELVLTERFDSVGGQCFQCGALDAKPGRACRYCNGPLELGSLRDAIVERAVSSGKVRIVADHPRHQGVGGISALLRPIRLNTGLPEGFAPSTEAVPAAE